MPFLSVIIPTRNRAERLAACLKSVDAQSMPARDFEVIVVDNGSSDTTPDVVAASAPRIRSLRYTSEPAPGLHAARHRGMRAASGDILVFADDDIEAAPGWLAAIAESFADSRVALVGGNVRPAFEQTPPTWLQALWDRRTARGRMLGPLSLLDFGDGRFPIDPGEVWGCNFSIRRDVLKQAGGFHPDALPPELVLYRGDGETHVSNHVRAAGLVARFDSRASVTHFVPAARMTPEYFARRNFAQGISDSYAAIRRVGRAPGLRERVRALRSRAGARLRWRDALRELRENEVGRQLRRVLRRAHAAYTDGYWLHMRTAIADPGLLDWILRKDYFDAIVPAGAMAPYIQRHSMG